MTFSDAEVIQRCKQATPDQIIGGSPIGNQILKLNSDLVVKFGFLLSENEARNQAKAYEILDASIVRVPRVHRFFTDSDRYGYIVMDFMEGRTKDSVTESCQIYHMSRVLEHFGSFKAQEPGPLAGGPSYCFLFGDSDPPTFNSVEDMENWFNIRLCDSTTGVSLQGLDLVICHLDLFPRNILWLEGQAPCVLDWASAGFYPQIFERCSQLITQQPDENKVILDQSITPFMSRQIELLRKAWWNNIRYCFAPPSPARIEITLDPAELPPSSYPYPTDSFKAHV